MGPLLIERVTWNMLADASQVRDALELSAVQVPASFR